MPGETEIINMALDLLSEEPIMSPTDNRPSVRWMRRNFQPTLDALLRKHPWNFAVMRADLAPLADAPVSGWAKAFQLPPNCMRLLQLTYGGCLNAPSIKYAVEGRQIVTDAEANPLSIVFIGRPDDLATLDPIFVKTLATTLGSEAASWMTGKQSYAQTLGQQAQALMLEAQMVDGQEGTPADPEQDEWLLGRWNGPTPYPWSGSSSGGWW